MDAGIPTPSKPLRAAGTAELLKHSYIGLTLPAHLLAPLNLQLEALLGEDYAELKGNRDARDGESYHMTLVGPSELRPLRKAAKSSGKRFEFPTERFELEILGIGTAEKEGGRAWFAVCRSEAVAAWRSALKLPAKDLHITLAFGAEGDVHGVPKGIDSLITDPDTES